MTEKIRKLLKIDTIEPIDHIFFDLTEEIEELLPIFRFRYSSNNTEKSVKSGLASTFLDFLWFPKEGEVCPCQG